MPRFSVIIPAYNAEGFIAQAVESALAQSYPAHEVIVVDDGSTDRTAAALEPYLDRIVHRHHANRGIGATRNAAIELATGDWAVLLDHDDHWHPRRLEVMAAFLAEHPEVGLVTTDAEVAHPDGSVTRYYATPYRRPGDDDRTALIRRNFVYGGAAFPIERWRAIGGFDEDRGIPEDWDLWFRLQVAGTRIAVIDEPLAIRRVHDTNASGDRVAMLRKHVRFRDKLLARDDLSAEERAICEEERGRVLTWEFSKAPTRRLAWSVLRLPRARARTRMKAAVALLRPEGPRSGKAAPP